MARTARYGLWRHLALAGVRKVTEPREKFRRHGKKTVGRPSSPKPHSCYRRPHTPYPHTPFPHTPSPGASPRPRSRSPRCEIVSRSRAVMSARPMSPDPARSPYESAVHARFVPTCCAELPTTDRTAPHPEPVATLGASRWVLGRAHSPSYSAHYMWYARTSVVVRPMHQSYVLAC